MVATDSRDPEAASVLNPQPESTSTNAEPATNDTSPDPLKAAKSASTPVEQATRSYNSQEDRRQDLQWGRGGG